MNRHWLLANRDFLVRDLVRDYCLVHKILTDQRFRFEADGTVSYTALRDLLGESTRKGIFGRLKDTSHHLFRNVLAAGTGEPAAASSLGHPSDPSHVVDEVFPGAGEASPSLQQDEDLPFGKEERAGVEALIDWCIGYAFHECAKLREDAFQGQHYANRLLQISRFQGIVADMCNPLRDLDKQTAESSSRELARIMRVLGQGLQLLSLYLAVEQHNIHLARWFASEEVMARDAFGESYDMLPVSLRSPSVPSFPVERERSGA